MSSSDSNAASASDSDSGSEQGLQHANASSAEGASRAIQTQLHGHSAQRHVNSNQSHSNDDNDLQRKLAVIQIEYPQRHQSQSAPSTVDAPRSRTSSMAASVLSRSTIASGGPSSRYSASTAPSLSRSALTAKSGSSLRTGSAASAVLQHYRLDQSEEDTSEEEVNVRLECYFSFLRCSQVFNDVETWDRHGKAHFRGALPSVACCPFRRCDWSRNGQSDHDVWAQRLRHMKEEHGGESFVYRKGRPDPTVIEQLRRNGAIDVAQYQELRRDGCLSEQSVLHVASRRQEQEGRRRR